jgi:hypothetical protein
MDHIEALFSRIDHLDTCLAISDISNVLRFVAG